MVQFIVSPLHGRSVTIGASVAGNGPRVTHGSRVHGPVLPSWRDASGGVHLVAGSAVGALTPSLPIACAAGIGSHVALDAVPHRDYQTWTANGIDTVVGLVVVALFARRLPRRARARAIAGAWAGVMPDIEVVACRAGLLAEEAKRFPTHSGKVRHGRGGPLSTVILWISAVAGAMFAVRAIRNGACRKTHR